MTAASTLHLSRPVSSRACFACDRPGSVPGGPISSEATPGPVFHGWHAGARIVASLDGPPDSVPANRPNSGQPALVRPWLAAHQGVRSIRIEEEPCEATG